MSLLHRPDDYNGFTPSSPPQISQQNCDHVFKEKTSFGFVGHHCRDITRS